jgi:hypothetical protein
MHPEDHPDGRPDYERSRPSRTIFSMRLKCWRCPMHGRRSPSRRSSNGPAHLLAMKCMRRPRHSRAERQFFENCAPPRRIKGSPEKWQATDTRNPAPDTGRVNRGSRRRRSRDTALGYG